MMKYLLLTVTLLYVSGLKAAASCELSVAWEPWPPYQIGDGKYPHSGIDYEITELVAGLAGCQVKWKKLVWARVLKQIEKGKLDMTPTASYTAERAKWGVYTKKSYRKESMALFVHKNHVSKYSFTSLADILKVKDFRLGTTMNYHYGTEFDSMRKQLAAQKRLVESNVDEKSYIKLLNKKTIDGFLGDAYVTPFSLKERNLDQQVAKVPVPVTDSDIYFLFSQASQKRLPGLVGKFDDAITKALGGQGSKSIAGILRKYQLTSH